LQLLELLHGGEHTAAEQRKVVATGAGAHGAFLRIHRTDALAINVRGEGRIAERGELLRALLSIILETGPVMHDKDAWPGTGNAVVPREKAFQSLIAVFVGNGFRPDGGV
jgi:hypothetical protein